MRIRNYYNKSYLSYLALNSVNYFIGMNYVFLNKFNIWNNRKSKTIVKKLKKCVMCYDWTSTINVWIIQLGWNIWKLLGCRFRYLLVVLKQTFYHRIIFICLTIKKVFNAKRNKIAKTKTQFSFNISMTCIFLNLYPVSV